MEDNKFGLLLVLVVAVVAAIGLLVPFVNFDMGDSSDSAIAGQAFRAGKFAKFESSADSEKVSALKAEEERESGPTDDESAQIQEILGELERLASEGDYDAYLELEREFSERYSEYYEDYVDQLEEMEEDFPEKYKEVLDRTPGEVKEYQQMLDEYYDSGDYGEFLRTYQEYEAQFPEYAEEYLAGLSESGYCADEIDNDMDGYTDCMDLDCEGEVDSSGSTCVALPDLILGEDSMSLEFEETPTLYFVGSELVTSTEDTVVLSATIENIGSADVLSGLSQHTFTGSYDSTRYFSLIARDSNYNLPMEDSTNILKTTSASTALMDTLYSEGPIELEFEYSIDSNDYGSWGVDELDESNNDGTTLISLSLNNYYEEEIECFSDSHCSSGEICFRTSDPTQNQCVECYHDGQCSTGETCDLSTYTCWYNPTNSSTGGNYTTGNYTSGNWTNSS